MNTVREIKTAILSTNLTNDEINELSMALRFARGQLSKQVKRSLRVGSTVQFTGRNGLTQGTLTKVAIKFATVKVGMINWRVPMNMLTLAEETV
jgi:ABC-type Mn2+/Zn2+ transport system ATPase subunit